MKKSLAQLPIRTGFALATLTLSLSGCGGGSTAPAAQSPAVLTVPAAEKAPAIRSASTVDTIQARRARELVSLLTQPGADLPNWEEAHTELLELGPHAVPVLAEKLQHGTDVERELAATTLALVGPSAGDAATALVAALQDSSPFVRANAAAALVQLPDYSRQAIPTLIGLLDADDPQLRQLAAVNLSAVGADASPYVDNLKRTLAQTNPPEVLTPVVELLGRIGAPAEPALPELQKIKFEQPGEVGDAATNAIQLITGGTAAP
ncbi:HEAT repeat domain-containing protein [Planctomicrobium piriforme]|uniref:HEAT repeat domain-containing protein n=1 Tax=Planctomicrobium piriforme TaxID=1576369 RepID=UPI00158726A2|nr:HEAT repeat domain-containing protein [Planctomicrobium piriforme]